MKKFIIIGIIMLVIDVFFLNYNKNYFNTVFKNIQGSDLNVKYIGAFICYIILVGVIKYFIIDQNKSILDAFILGSSIYGVYELTNYATFNNWPLKMVLLDTTWGGVLFSLVTFFYKYLTNF